MSNPHWKELGSTLVYANIVKSAIRPGLSVKAGWAAIPRFSPSVNKPCLRFLFTGPRAVFVTKRRKRAFYLKRPKVAPKVVPKAASQLEPQIAPKVVPKVAAQHATKRRHDLLTAVAELGALEQRIGYRFKDKLLGMSAFKISSDNNIVIYEDKAVKVERFSRLALLGDRVLSMALCVNWYKTGQIVGEHAVMSHRLVSRVSCAQMSRKLELERNIMTNTPLISQNVLAEVFEALLGAIYVDSRYDLNMVQEVLRAIDFGDDHAKSEPESAATGQLETRKDDHVNSEPESAATGQLETRKRPSLLSETAASKSFHLHVDSLDRVPHIHSIFTDLAHIIFHQKDLHAVTLGVHSHVLVYKTFDALRMYFNTCLDIHVLCLWFPGLRARCARLYHMVIDKKNSPQSQTIQRPVGVIRGFTVNRVFAKKGEEEYFPRFPHNSIGAIIRTAFTELNIETSCSISNGTVIEYLRHERGLGARDAFLTALRVEERTRDHIRQSLGLPDWYDLPENKDKVLPPWRLVEKLPGLHAETGLSMHVQPERDCTVQPPLLLDTARPSELELDSPSSSVRSLAEDTPARYTPRTDIEDEPSLIYLLPSPASTETSSAPSAEESSGPSQAGFSMNRRSSNVGSSGQVGNQ